MTPEHSRDEPQQVDVDEPSSPVAPPGPTRRGFLGAAAGLTGAALLAAPSAASAAVGPVRSFAAGHFALEINGENVGLVKSVEGGGISAEVVSEPFGESFFQRKHLAAIRYEDFSIQFPFGLQKSVSDWIASTWRGEAPSRDGAVHALDFKFNIVSSRQFQAALITETSIPACDASSKEPAYLTLTLNTESTTNVKGDGKLSADSSTGQKVWLASNFKLEIDGLDCSKVNKIDAFTVKQTAVQDETGETRDPSRQAGRIEYPNLTFYLPETSGASWDAWFDDFAIKGNNGQDKERKGRLDFLSPNRVDVLLSITFFNLGIFKLSSESSASDSIRRLKAELYCERMEFTQPSLP